MKYKLRKIRAAQITVVGTIGIIAPFIHILFIDSGVEGVFGFQDLETFLFCAGFPLLSISAGFLLLFASTISSEFRRIFTIFSILFLFVGMFFLIWSLMPSVKDFDPLYYYSAMVFISIGGTIIFYYFNKALIVLNKKIEYLICLISNVRTDHFFKLVDKVNSKNINSKELNKSIVQLDKEINTTFKKL